MAYAESTTVPSDRSRNQIEAVLHRYGARGFGYMTEGNIAQIVFKMLGPDGSPMAVRMTLPLPCRDSDEFCKTPTGKDRSPDAALKSWEQACRSAWRSLYLVVKAKLEAVDAGISTIEREFMPDLLLPNGTTVGEQVLEQREALARGGRLKLLTAG